MIVNFDDKSFYVLESENALLHVTLRAIHENSPNEGTKIRFIFDTGAYLTVISRGTAIKCGFDKLPKTTTYLFGFGGGLDVDFVRIPGLMVLNKLISNVPVLIPHDEYRKHKNEKKLIPDVLGLNVLEYYNYFVDTENGRLYLKENPTPRFYSSTLASGQTFLADATDKEL